MGQTAKKTIKNTSSMIEEAAKKQKQNAQDQKIIYEDQLEELKNNRQDIVNPYAGITLSLIHI